MENNLEPVVVSAEPEKNSKLKIILVILFFLLIIAVLFFVGWKMRQKKTNSPVASSANQLVEQQKQAWQTNLNQVASQDQDFDNLTDTEEKQYNTNPNKPDTDGDGLLDGAEVKTFHTDPLKADTDGDGKKDGQEIRFGTDPLVKNTK